MRAVRDEAEIAEAFARCRSEAASAFGDGSLYAERLIERARHIEVQILGDRHGGLTHFGERECTIQRRNQKLIEVAPSPSLTPAHARADRRGGDADRARGALTTASARSSSCSTRGQGRRRLVRLHRGQSPPAGRAHRDRGGVRRRSRRGADPRRRRARASPISASTAPRAPRGYAIQARVNLETMTPAGEAVPPAAAASRRSTSPRAPACASIRSAIPATAQAAAFRFADRQGHRAFGVADFAAAAARRRARSANSASPASRRTSPSSQALLAHPDFVANRIDTRFVETHLAELLQAAAQGASPPLFRRAGGGRGRRPRATALDGPEGTIAVAAPLQGTVVSLDVADGDLVRPGQQIAVIESMKMEHLVTAPMRRRRARDARPQGRHALSRTTRSSSSSRPTSTPRPRRTPRRADPDAIRPDLADMLARQAFGHDANRPEAVAKRRKTNHRTARENVAALVDPGSFIEYGSLAVAAQAARRSRDDLIRNTPGDGVVAGLATVNGDLFGPDARPLHGGRLRLHRARRHPGRAQPQEAGPPVSRIAEKQRLPVVLFAEGGGGRPGDTEGFGVTGLDVPTFAQFARLSGLAPLVGVASGPLLRRQRGAARLLRRRSSRRRIPRSAWAARR